MRQAPPSPPRGGETKNASGMGWGFPPPSPGCEGSGIVAGSACRAPGAMQMEQVAPGGRKKG